MTDPSSQDDITLLLRIAQKDRQAFAAFFDRFAVRVKAFMLRSGTGMDDADEIAQDVMVSVWRRADSFDPAKAAVSTWVFAIARNRRIDMLRKHSRPAPDPHDPLFQPDPEPTGIDVVSATQTQKLMREALMTLPDDQRVVLMAAFFDGMSHGEVAAHLDLPLGTVKSRIRLAFKHLKATLPAGMMEGLLDD